MRGGAQQSLGLTAPDPSAVPEPLARLLDVVVVVPPLRLAEHGMSVTRTADTLGISRATTYRRISRYGISVPRS